MKEQKGVNLQVQEEQVTTEKFQWSDLWKKEDWLAVWIGFFIIAVGAAAVLTGVFDFSAAKFTTWGNGTSILEQLNGALSGKLVLTAVVLGVLFTAGNAFMGTKIKV